jgi:hypothetical protein
MLFLNVDFRVYVGHLLPSYFIVAIYAARSAASSLVSDMSGIFG